MKFEILEKEIVTIFFLEKFGFSEIEKSVHKDLINRILKKVKKCQCNTEKFYVELITNELNTKIFTKNLEETYILFYTLLPLVEEDEDLKKIIFINDRPKVEFEFPKAEACSIKNNEKDKKKKVAYYNKNRPF